jgi:hypothetical protein
MTSSKQIIFSSVTCLFLVGAIAPGSADAQDEKQPNVVGVWNVVAESEQGERDSTWTIEKSGDDYTGEFSASGGLGDLEMTNISLKGNLFTFEVEVAGNGQELVIEIESEIKGNKVSGNYVVFSGGDEVAAGDLSGVKEAAEFDGSTLDSFRGYGVEEIGSGWGMDSGVLHLDGTKSGDIMTKQEFGDFELEFDWKISEAGNSGVMYRVSLGDKKAYFSGPEYQILDDDKHKDGKLESHRSGSLYALYVPKNKTLKPVGEWNKTKIVLKGNSVEHWLNGKKVVEAELGSDDWNEKVAASKFQKWKKFGKNKKGHICFQDHGDPVWYRNIKIKSMD